MSESIPHVESQKELDKYLKESENKLVVLMVYAHWCGPSLYMEPVFEELSYANKHCVFLRLNTNRAPDMVDSLDVNRIPTFFFYRNGDKVDELVGANEHRLKQSFAKNNV